MVNKKTWLQSDGKILHIGEYFDNHLKDQRRNRQVTLFYTFRSKNFDILLEMKY